MAGRPQPLAFLAALLTVMTSAGAASPDFTKDIAPLLTKYCAGCHNDTDREGKLSLASYASLIQGGEKGGVVTPGQPEISRIVRVLTGAAEPRMPPEGEQSPTAAEIEALKAWIAGGAQGPSGAVSEFVLAVPQVKLLAAPRLAVNAVAVSPDGALVAVARHGSVELLSSADQARVLKLESIPGSVNDAAFSAGGERLVIAAGEPGLFGEARVYRVGDGALVRAFRGHKDSLYCARLSPDGRWLATGGYDNAIKLWDVETGQEARSLEGHNGAVFELAFRADGNVLASASGDRTVKLWKVATGERLDTLKESQKELYCLAFSPDGTRLAAAGVDNRIRVWEIAADAKEGTNPLAISKFAHDTPILRLEWSADGKTLVSSGEDRLVKVWNAESMTIRQTLAPLSDWATGLAINQRGSMVVVGCVDGTLRRLAIESAREDAGSLLTPLAETPPEVDYGPQPRVDELVRIAEVEPNDQPRVATAIAAPGRASGTIDVDLGSDGTRSVPATGVDDGTRSVPATLAATWDVDLFSFAARAGEQWVIETNAARSKSPLDSKVEVLDSRGESVPRLLLRAVRDSVIEFRGMTSEQRGVRLANWEEMLLNEYVYLSGDVIKLFQQRRGPDADAQFYPENGNRLAFFDTTSRAHALGEPAYVVVPYAVGSELPGNGLPVFTIHYENDDDSQRKLGKDSRLTFVAPADGTYFVRVSDVRGFSGGDFKYELIVRRPQPDFNVSLSTKELTISAGSGKPFVVKAERLDHFEGSIRVDLAGLPSGIQVTTPVIIEAGHSEASGLIYAAEDAAGLSSEGLKSIQMTATATVCGQQRTKDVAAFTGIKLGDKPKVLVYLTPSDGAKPGSVGLPTSVDSTSPGAGLLPAVGAVGDVVIAPGGRVACRLRVERNGFDDRIAFDVANLPHGVIVDDIGLSGVLIPEKQTERTIFLRAEPWVQAQTRTFFATAQVDGNQSSLPLMLEVRGTTP